MRGDNSYKENLFSTLRLDELVPENEVLRPICIWLNDALAGMDVKHSAMYEADFKTGGPGIASERLMGAMLLQVLYSVLSARQLVEQISYNLLFCWFVGRSIEESLWNHSLFNNGRDRLIEHDAVSALSNATVEMAGKRGLLSRGHLSVDGTLIQAWTSHKSVRCNDGSHDDRPLEGWLREPRSIETHRSTTPDASLLYRKSSSALALPSHSRHVLTARRNCAVVNVRASQSTGTAERDVEAEMQSDVGNRGKPIPVATEKADDTMGLVKASYGIDVRPHIARNTAGNGGSAIEGCIKRHAGCSINQRKRRRIEQCFCLRKVIGPIRQVIADGVGKVGLLFTLRVTAYDLTGLRSLGPLHAESVR